MSRNILGLIKFINILAVIINFAALVFKVIEHKPDYWINGAWAVLNSFYVGLLFGGKYHDRT